MNVALFVTYPLRSLRRGGRSTQLAVLCITIGVMAVVAIQLIGLMATSSYEQNARVANGGDISVQVLNRNASFTQNDLSVFAHLKGSGTIQEYTPVNIEQGAIGALPAPANGLLVQVVDPEHFPLVSPPVFVSPVSGSLSTLLVGNQVVVTRTFLTYYHMHMGQSFDLQIQSPRSNGVGRTLHAHVAGVIANQGGYPAGNTFVLVSFATYQEAHPTLPVTYESIDIVTQDQTHTDLALSALQQELQQRHLPPVSFLTAAQVQQHVQVFNNQIMQLQELAGILILLVAGLGIMNTMRVLLARRTLEIAMLKTAGYSRSSLALLFGIETGVLGLLGGLLGTGMALVVSYGVVRTLLLVPFQPDFWTLAGGLTLGTCTALCFGLVPIVQSASLRPIEVMRGYAGGTASSRFQAGTLYACVVLLFCLLASVILGNLLLACACVCGVVAFLMLFGLGLRPLLRGISAFPLPEGPVNKKFLVGVLVSMMCVGIFCAFFPLIGGLVLSLLLLALVSQLMPLRWKMNARMALRNLDRRPMRVTMLILILCVGVFSIGSIQAIGQDLQSQLATAMNQALSSNVIIKLPRTQAQTMQALSRRLPGLLSSYATTTTATSLVMVNGQPWQSFLPSTGSNEQSQQLTAQVLSDFDGVEGYDLAHRQTPDPALFHIVAGRNLNVSDVGTNHVLIPAASALTSTFSLDIGSMVTVKDVESGVSTTVTVVGEYRTTGISLVHISPLLASQNLVMQLSPVTAQAVYYLKVDPVQVTQAEATLVKALPDLAFVRTPASNISSYLQGITSITQVFTVIIGFVLLTGMLILANTVLLDVFERRRELGILKALGYTRQIIQGEILFEYSLIGGIGAFLAIVLVALLTNLLGNTFLSATIGHLERTGTVLVLTFSPNGWLLAGLIGGTLLMVLITSLLASWRTVRIPPLDVLRSE